MQPTDVRDRGKVVQAHQIQINRRHKQYRDGLEALVEAADDLLRDVLGTGRWLVGRNRVRRPAGGGRDGG